MSPDRTFGGLGRFGDISVGPVCQESARVCYVIVHSVVAGILEVRAILIGGAEGVLGDVSCLQKVVFVECALFLGGLRTDILFVVANLLSATLAAVVGVEVVVEVAEVDLGVTDSDHSGVAATADDVALLL